MGLLLILGLAAAGLLLATSKKGATIPAGGAPGSQGVRSPGATPGMSTTPSSIAGMTPAQIAQAVATALQVETNPDNLREFANSLLPDYAQYAAQLNARAAQLSAQPAPPPGQPAPLPPPPPAPLPQPPPQPAPAPPPPPAVVPNPPPTPASFPDAGSTAYVVTHDTGPSGSLNIRDTPATTGVVLTQVGHGTGVTILGPSQDGWFPVQTPSGVQGYASGQYLGPNPPADAPLGPGAGQELVAQEGQALSSGSSA